MLELLVVVVCLVINAVLSSTEMAFVSAGRSQLRELSRRGSSSANHLLEMKNRPERILSIIQIGITLVSAVAAAVGGAGAEESLSPYFISMFAVSPETASTLSIAIVVIPLTAFTVIFGELFPKAIALRRPVQISVWMTPFLVVADRYLRPVITAMEVSTKRLLRLFRISTQTVHQHEPETGKQYAISFGLKSRMTVKEIMIPFTETVTVDISMSIEEVERIFSESGHTRLPIMNQKKVVGILNSKEFSYFKASKQTDWITIARGAIYFEEDMDLMQALKILQGQHRHMGIVLGEQGISGIITLSTILEEFVGDIYDEDDDNFVRQLVLSRGGLKR